MMTSCDSDELTEQERSEITKQIENRVHEYEAAARELDIDSVYDFWANVDGFSMAADGSTLPLSPSLSFCVKAPTNMPLSIFL